MKRRAGIASLVYSKEPVLEGVTREFSVEGNYLRITVRLIDEKGA